MTRSVRIEYRTKRFAVLVAAVFGLLCLSAVCVAQDAVPDVGALKSGLSRIASEHGFRGVRFRYEPFGQKPVDVTAGAGGSDTTVALGSISKSVTGIGIALLIQQGKVRLDSKLEDVLSEYFNRRGTPLDPSLRPITIERLLTHRAGLRANAVADTSKGLRSRDVTDRIGGSPHFFKYLTTAKAGTSDGTEGFVYSNLSYLILGMVIEAVSGETYQDFCQRNIFRPLGIMSATIPSQWNVVAPFGGWRMTLGDLLNVWSVFDVQKPTTLTAATLKATLLGRLGGPIRADRHVYYTLGVYVRQDVVDGPYVLNHDGLAGYVRGATNEYAFAEKFVPGYAWAIGAWPGPGDAELGRVSGAVTRDVRLMLRGDRNAER